MLCGTPKSDIASWRDKRIFVLGDVMLDRFVSGRVERLSPEAPIPILHFQSEKFMVGGAANVARNIAALAGKAVLVGVLGEDEHGDLIARSVAELEHVEGSFVRVGRHPTTVKTCFVSEGQQIMRLDVERRLDLDKDQVAEICARFEDVAGRIDAVVLSDYAKGVLSPVVIRGIVDMARARGLPVVVDPKTKDVRRYSGASVLTPNRSEAAMITNFDCDTDETAEAAAKVLRDLAEVDAVVLTRGAQGMTIYDPVNGESRPSCIPTAAREVFDVSGAGDTVAAVLSLALAGGMSVATGARIANVAAGIVVGKRGTAVVKASELASALRALSGANPKIVAADAADAIVNDWNERGLRVGFTNGCFDLLHPGHVELLRRARASCDRLVVGLNSDASVRRLKGPTRPVQNENARSTVMASIGSVDLVILFEEDTPLGLIQLLKPDVLIKGGDYTIDTVVGADFVQAYGGKTLLVPLEAGHSTTSIISRAEVLSQIFTVAGKGLGR